MKLGVTATGKDLEAKIDPRFGRTPYFIMMDPETGLTYLLGALTYLSKTKTDP